MNIAVKFPPVKQLEMKPVSIFAPKARACPHNNACESPELCDGYGECKLDHTSVRGPDLDKLAAELSRNKINEIAALVASLTYGEMMTLGDGLWGKLPQDRPVKPADFPAMLHEWSKGRD